MRLSPSHLPWQALHCPPDIALFANSWPPSSYTVEGTQYVVVAAGGNAQLNYKRGNNIIAFTLAD